VEPSARDDRLERWWAVGIGLFASFLLVVGPLQVFLPQIDEAIAVVSIVLILLSVWRLRADLPSRFASPALLLLGLGLLLLGAQLVPLPVSVWTSFPGRQVVLDSLAAAKVEAGPMPLTLDPFTTRSVVLYIMPSMGLFFASLSISPQFRRDWAITIVAVAVSCALLGLLQRFQGANSPLFMYPNSELDLVAKGTFQNRNFFAAQLYCSVPLVAALGVATLSGRGINRFVIVLMLFVYFLTLMAALGASDSRGGLGLAMLAVLLSSALVWSSRNRAAETTSSKRFAFPIVIVGVFLVAQFGMVALLRIAQTDTASDLRGTMAATTFEAIKAYFPVGSGFGSFVPVYRLFEHPDQLVPKYINNAHNDWLQLALEGGLPMIVLMAGFIVWYLAASFKIWRIGTNSLEDLLLRAASLIVFLLLLHSIFDYPLRTRALMGMFAMCCGFLAYGVHLKPLRNRLRHSSGTGHTSAEPRPARSAPYFIRKNQSDGT
jgi:O-antigen ligase